MSGRMPDIIAVMKRFFSAHFPGATWGSWIVLAKAIFALTMTPAELETYSFHTGRKGQPTKKALEVFLVVSRRAGKSIFAALLIVFQAFFFDWKPYLAPGELASIVVICPDRWQARTIFGYVTALIESVPQLAAMVEKKYTERLLLTCGVQILIGTANLTNVRGLSVIGGYIDEGAFLPCDTMANPDTELLNAIRPAMATFGDKALLYFSSSPFARRGELWKAHKRFFGKEQDEVLVWQATSQEMNPTLPSKLIARAYEEDPIRAAAEYGGTFRRDVESFVSPEAIAAVTVSGRTEIVPQ